VNALKFVHILAFILVVVGGLNWGLVGIFDFNLVHAILGSLGFIENLVYILVALSALYLLFTHKGDCKTCSSSTSTM
jgi:uncharacterized membrane protein YuzA (DUF378 family)